MLFLNHTRHTSALQVSAEQCYCIFETAAYCGELVSTNDLQKSMRGLVVEILETCIHYNFGVK